MFGQLLQSNGGRRVRTKWSFSLFQPKPLPDSTIILLNIKTLRNQDLVSYLLSYQGSFKEDNCVLSLWYLALLLSFVFPPSFPSFSLQEYCTFLCVCVRMCLHSRGYQLILNPFGYTFKSSFPGQVLLPGNKGHESVNIALLLGLKSLWDTCCIASVQAVVICWRL